MLVSAGLSVWLLNWFYRLGVRGDRERDAGGPRAGLLRRARPLARRRARPRAGAAAGRPPAIRTGADGPSPSPGRDAALSGPSRRLRPRCSPTPRRSPTSPSAPARPAGSGIDTEFMGEGRYQPLLCLVQVAVEAPDGDDHGRGPRPARRGARPRAARRAARRPGDRGRPARRAPGRRAAAPRVGHRGHERSSTRRSPRASPACARSSATRRCCTRCSACGCARARASRAGTPARSAPSRSTTRARTSCTCSSSPTRCRRRSADRGRLEWAREECRALEEVSDERDLDALFARLPRVNGAGPGAARGRPRARRLARATRRATPTGPPRACCSDAALVEIAKRRPRSAERLAQIRGLHEGTLRRRGPAILAAVARGREQPPIPRRRRARRRTPIPRDAPLIALGEALVRARATEAELAYELIAARADLQRIVTAVRTDGAERRRAHAAGLAPRGGRRGAARAAARPPRAARRPGPAHRGQRARRAGGRRLTRSVARMPSPAWPGFMHSSR